MGWEEESELPVSDEAREVAKAYDSASIHNKNIVRAALSLPPLPQSISDNEPQILRYAAKGGGVKDYVVKDPKRLEQVLRELDASEDG